MKENNQNNAENNVNANLTGQKAVVDIIGIELSPGKPNFCLGNGKQGFECCCDVCDYFLLCFSEFNI